MTELHVYRSAGCVRLEVPVVNPSVRMLLTVLYEVQHWLQAERNCPSRGCTATRAFLNVRNPRSVWRR